MSQKPTETLHFAEYVSPGHPDRLADAIAERIVRLGTKNGFQSTLVGVEVAIHDDQVFIDGRFAQAFSDKEFKARIRKDMADLVRDVFKSAGYGDRWRPRPEELQITNVTCIEPLQDGEADIRGMSDDQNLVIGYAEPSPGTNHLPPIHFLANRIGRALWKWRAKRADTYGPDFKILPFLKKIRTGGKTTWQWERLTLSLQHRPGTFYEQQHGDLLPFLEGTLAGLEKATGLSGIGTSFELRHLHLNGAGDFCQGGPEGDNGLSGKKLVVDHYGPEVPIGGGAICGKDPHKVDRVGPLRARQLAKRLTRQHDKPARVRLGWSPGEEAPFFVEAALENSGIWQSLKEIQLPPRDWYAIETIFGDLGLGNQAWASIVLDGYFMDEELPWEL